MTSLTDSKSCLGTTVLLIFVGTTHLFMDWSEVMS